MLIVSNQVINITSFKLTLGALFQDIPLEVADMPAVVALGALLALSFLLLLVLTVVVVILVVILKRSREYSELSDTRAVINNSLLIRTTVLQLFRSLTIC